MRIPTIKNKDIMDVEEDNIKVEAIEKVDEDGSELRKRPKFDLKPTLIIITGAVLGLCLGIGLANGRGGEITISWIKLPGDLFIRALNCIVLPLVFVNIFLAMVDMIRAGKASSVGSRTIGFFTFTTVLASIEGLIAVLLFQSTFTKKNEEGSGEDPLIALRCQRDGDDSSLWLTEQADGSLSCTEKDENNSGIYFVLENVNGVLVESDSSTVDDDISFSETLQDGIFRKMVSKNLFGEFVDGNFLGVVMIALVFGAASQSLAKPAKGVIELMEEANRLLMKIIEWIIYLTPIAVLSLIAGNIGAQDDLYGVFRDIGVLIAATLMGMSFHFLVVYPTLFIFFVRKNPLPYAKFLVPAQIFGFASASSAATLPLCMECVAATGEVPKSVYNFVLSMGSTINMDGGAIYFPCAIVFLAVAEGLEDQLNPPMYFLIILLSTVGSAGTAPVPSSALVLIITAYNTAFDKAGTPDSFGLILAIDWFINRFRVLLNVTGDMTTARIITAICNVTDDDDVLENEAADDESKMDASSAISAV